jgi:hypothetical protein
MILKGSQRSGAKPLAVHLLNERDNDHVELFELRGFASDMLIGALRETEAIAKGTRCTQYMFSLSLNPPKGAVVGEEQFREAADEAEKRLGLEGQPRAIVIHEKEGRRHAHVVWSRIDAETMRAINIPHYKYKLNDLTKELYLKHDWPLPEGLKHAGGKSPLNFTLDEWQQARRLDIDPREIKQIFREAWTQSDSLRAFGNALAERGFFLAQGDRRGFVALDVQGEAFAVAKWAGVKTKDVKARFGEPEQLPTFDAVRSHVAGLVTDKLRRFIADVKVNHNRDFSTLRGEMDAMRRAHRAERATLRTKQAERWQAETAENMREAIDGLARDRQQRDALVVHQMRDRSALQERITTVRVRHLKNRKLLIHARQQLIFIENLNPIKASRDRWFEDAELSQLGRNLRKG